MMQFNEWLAQQTGRDDAIGKLTRQLIHDSTSPLWSNKEFVYYKYFEKRKTCTATVAAFECALSEWKSHNDKVEHLESAVLA